MYKECVICLVIDKKLCKQPWHHKFSMSVSIHIVHNFCHHNVLLDIRNIKMNLSCNVLLWNHIHTPLKIERTLVLATTNLSCWAQPQSYNLYSEPHKFSVQQWEKIISQVILLINKKISHSKKSSWFDPVWYTKLILRGQSPFHNEYNPSFFPIWIVLSCLICIVPFPHDKAIYIVRTNQKVRDTST